MDNVRWFETKADYRDFVFSEIFKAPEVAGHPFYRRLIDFVIDQRSPLFHGQSDESEWFSFSTTYHFQLIRPGYTDPAFETLYFLHDFCHLLFEYPHDLRGVSEDRFIGLIGAQEYAASNESEILVHYRAPGIREQVLRDRRILFDVLRERGLPQPSACELYRFREQLIESDWFSDLVLGEEPDLQAWFRRFRGNDDWARDRYRLLRGHAPMPERDWRWLTPANYETVLAGYEREYGEERWRQNTLCNLQMAYALLGLDDPPREFADGAAAAERLEGEVLFATPRAVAA